MTAAARIPLDDDNDTWALIKVCAWLVLIAKVNLRDDKTVWRFLNERGVPASRVINLAPAVIERAREIIAEQETAQ